MNAKLKRYVKERDAMLKKRDINELRKFVINHAEFYSTEFVEAFMTASDEVVETTLHKMIVNAIKLPENLRYSSAIWLTMRGYKLEIGKH